MESYEVLDPSTGTVVKTYPLASDEDVARAVDAVAAAAGTGPPPRPPSGPR